MDRPKRGARKSKQSEFEQLWDDTELIKMYEESVSIKFIPMEKNADSDETQTRQSKFLEHWQLGDPCVAPFPDDGLFYNATIKTMDHEQGLVEVEYDDYGNVEWVRLVDIAGRDEFAEWCEEEKEGLKSEEETSEQNTTENAASFELTKKKKGNFFDIFPGISECSTANQNSSSSAKEESFLQQLFDSEIVPPTVPTAVPENEGINEKTAFSKMLTSWYMSGYHTGYYQALKDSQKKS